MSIWMWLVGAVCVAVARGEDPRRPAEEAAGRRALAATRPTSRGPLVASPGATFVASDAGGAADRRGRGVAPIAAARTVGSASATCPEGDCVIFSNPYGLDPPPSNAYLCYDPATGATADARGAPASASEFCTASQRAECASAAECQTRVGPGCACFVSSCLEPYDACEGEGEACGAGQCTGYECGAYHVACSTAYGGGGTCLLVNDTVGVPAGNCSASAPTSRAEMRLQYSPWLALLVAIGSIACR